MPTYTMRAPNGKTYEIEGPPGATEEQVRTEILRRDPAAATPPTDTGGSSVLRAILGAVTPEMRTEKLFGVNIPTPKLPKPSAALPLALGGAPGIAGALGRIGAAGLGGAMEAPGARVAGVEKAMTLPAIVEGVTGGASALARLPALQKMFGRLPKVTETTRTWSESPWASRPPLPSAAPATIPSPILDPFGRPSRTIPTPPMTPAGPQTGPVNMTETVLEHGLGRPPQIPPQLRAILDYFVNR